MARLPVKTIHINKSPVVIGNLKTLAPAMAERWGLDLALGQQHAAWAQAHAAELARCPWGAVFDRPAPDSPPDVDEDLYGGFIGPADRRMLDRLRTLDGAALARKHPAFEDTRLDELLFRYRARHWPEHLQADERQRWQAHCHARLHHGTGGGLTLADYSARIDALAESLADDDDRGQDILAQLVDWAEQIAPG
jgi:exodeoxyribonuclease I